MADNYDLHVSRVADQLDALARTVGGQVQNVVDAVTLGELAPATGGDLSATLTELGNAQSQQLAQNTYAQERAVQIGQIPDELPPRPPHALDGARLQTAAQTIVEGKAADVGARLVRLATSEVLEAFHTMTSSLLRSDPMAMGWERGINTNACQLCVWWWRGGQFWAPNHAMPTHKGCACVQIPGWTTEVEYIDRRTSEIQAWQDGAAERAERAEQRQERADKFATLAEQTRKKAGR